MPPRQSELPTLHGVPILEVFRVPGRLACITLDFEMDYGDRVAPMNPVRDSSRVEKLNALFMSLGVPLSLFIRTDLLVRFPETFATIRKLGGDYHSHSHTHAMRNFDSEREIATTAATFEDFFGYRPLAYRAPQGVLYPGDLELLKAQGFKASASVFPFYRPKKFNHLTKPIEPFRYANGLLEFPFASIRTIRYTLSLSYLKLLGWPASRLLIDTCGLPNVVVIDSHLHDYIVDEESFRQLPLKLRAAWGVNKHAGVPYMRKLIGLLRAKGYQFTTITQLHDHLAGVSQ